MSTVKESIMRFVERRKKRLRAYSPCRIKRKDAFNDLPFGLCKMLFLDDYLPETEEDGRTPQTAWDILEDKLGMTKTEIENNISMPNGHSNDDDSIYNSVRTLCAEAALRGKNMWMRLAKMDRLFMRQKIEAMVSTKIETTPYYINNPYAKKEVAKVTDKIVENDVYLDTITSLTDNEITYEEALAKTKSIVFEKLKEWDKEHREKIRLGKRLHAAEERLFAEVSRLCNNPTEDEKRFIDNIHAVRTKYNFKNIEDLEENARKLLGLSAVALDGLNIGALNEIVGSLESIKNKYPLAFSTIKGIDSRAHYYAKYKAEYENRYDITIDDVVCGEGEGVLAAVVHDAWIYRIDQHIIFYRDTEKRIGVPDVLVPDSIDSPPQCHTLKAAVDHEFGHILDFFIKEHGGGLFTEHQTKIRSIYEESSKDGSLSIVSKYGRTNCNEFVAECWSEYNNNPQCRPTAKRVAKMMIREYKRIAKELKQGKQK